MISVNAKGEVFLQETKISSSSSSRGWKRLRKIKKTPVSSSGRSRDRVRPGDGDDRDGESCGFIAWRLSPLPQGDGAGGNKDQCDTALPFPYCCTA